jgi:hypothetical protein
MPHYVDCRSGEPPPQVAAWNQSDAFVFSNEVRWGAPNGSMCMHAAGRAACLPAPFPGGHNAPASPPPAWAPSLLPLQTLAYWWVWHESRGCNTRRRSVSEIQELFRHKRLEFVGDSHVRYLHNYIARTLGGERRQPEGALRSQCPVLCTPSNVRVLPALFYWCQAAEAAATCLSWCQAAEHFATCLIPTSTHTHASVRAGVCCRRGAAQGAPG